MVPARQAYSHWASVGRIYSHPAGISSASCSFKSSRNNWISFQDIFFHWTIGITRPSGWSGISIGMIFHDRLVLGLCNLVFAEVKSLSQSYIVLGFVRKSSCFARRASHCKSARFHPDHFQRNSRVEIDKMIGLGRS